MHSIEAPFLSVGPYARLTMAEMCVQCGEEIAPDALFCTECGARQAYSPAQSSTPPPAVHQASVTDLSSIVASTETVSAAPMNQGAATEQMQDLSVTQLGGARISGTPTLGDRGGSASDVLKGIAEGLSGAQESSESDKARNAATMGIDQRREFNSPTDQLVEDINIADREVKGRQRQAWLEMNQENTGTVTQQAVTAELPPHLREESTAVSAPAAAVDTPDPALFRRMTEVAMRRVARKRGISVEAPQVKDSDGIFMVNLTYNDDGRVLDTPEELMDAFDHAITTEASLKGYDVVLEVNIFRNQDGTIEKVAGYGGMDQTPTEEKREKRERRPQARKGSPAKHGKPPGQGRRKKPPGGGRRKSGPGRERGERRERRDEPRDEPRRGPSGGKPPGRGRGPPGGGGPSRKKKGPGGGRRGPSDRGSGGSGRGPPGGGGQRGPPGGGGRGPGGRPPPGPQRGGGRRGPPKSNDPEW